MNKKTLSRILMLVLAFAVFGYIGYKTDWLLLLLIHFKILELVNGFPLKSPKLYGLNPPAKLHGNQH